MPSPNANLIICMLNPSVGFVYLKRSRIKECKRMETDILVFSATNPEGFRGVNNIGDKGLALGSKG